MITDVGKEVALARWLRRLPKALVTYRSGLLYYRPLSERVILDSPPPEGLEFQSVAYENVGLIAEWKGEAQVLRLSGLLNRGYVGVFGVMGGKVVSQLWVAARLQRWSPGCWHEPIEVGEIMLGNLETRAGYRRLGISLYTRAAMQVLLVRLYGGRAHRTCGAARFANIASHGYQARLKNPPGSEDHEFVLAGLVCISRVWDVAQRPMRRIGRGRLIVRLKVPAFFFRPPRTGARSIPHPIPVASGTDLRGSDPA